MKKFLAVILSLVLSVPLGAGLFASASTRYAYATSEETKQYLIAPNFISEDDYQSKYNIVENADTTEVLRHTRPFDFDAERMMEGASISPNKIDGKIDKTFGVNNIFINPNLSMFVYVYFTEVYSRDLVLSLTGDGFNLSWKISADVIRTEIDHTSDTSHVRYGWMLLELPVSAAEVTGELGLVTGLKINYDASAMESEVVGIPYFYAPYLADAKSDVISFGAKQNYFVYAVDYKFLDSYCTGESYYISNLKSILKYAVIGEVDYLTYNPNNYHFNLEITLAETGKKTSQRLLDNGFSYKFENSGTYQFLVALYTDSGVWQWQTTPLSVVVNNFVPFYINSGIKDMQVGSTCEYILVKGSYANYINNVTVSSSNTKIADATLQDGNILVTAKKRGKTTITVTATVGRNGVEQQYTKEYQITITKPGNSPWVTIVVSAIVLIVAAIIVYTIMVRRRLIKNKYPKY